MRKTSIKFLAGVAATGLILSACGDDNGDNGGSDGTADPGVDVGEVVEDGSRPFGDSIRIGTKEDQPGTGLFEGGEYTGMDVDVAVAVAAALGYSDDEIDWLEAPTPQREDLLENEQVDYIVATYSINEPRKERVQFAGPYFISGQDLLIREDDDTITGPEDLADKRLCSVQGSTPAQRIADEYEGVDLVNYDTYSLCMEALQSGAVDAITTDDVILAGYAAQEQWAGQFSVVGNVFSDEFYGIGLNQDSEACSEINEIITQLWEDGTMEEIIEANLGPAGYTASDKNPPSADDQAHCA